MIEKKPKLFTPEEANAREGIAGISRSHLKRTWYRPDENGVNAGVLLHETGHSIMHGNSYTRLYLDNDVQEMFKHLREYEALYFSYPAF